MDEGNINEGFTPEQIAHHEKRADFILNNLGLKLEDLEGKRVLDIGSGESSISFVSRSKNIDAVSLDINPRRKPAVVSPWHEEKEAIVKADMEKLPFVNNSFDLIVAHASGASEVFADADRVLKPGGQVRQYPMYGAENWYISYYLWQVKGMSQEEVDSKMTELLSDQEEDSASDSDEYSDLLKESLATLTQDQKIEVLGHLKNHWQNILDMPLDLHIVDQTVEEPRGTLIYKKPNN